MARCKCLVQNNGTLGLYIVNYEKLCAPTVSYDYPIWISFGYGDKKGMERIAEEAQVHAGKITFANRTMTRGDRNWHSDNISSLITNFDSLMSCSRLPQYVKDELKKARDWAYSMAEKCR